MSDTPIFDAMRTARAEGRLLGIDDAGRSVPLPGLPVAWDDKPFELQAKASPVRIGPDGRIAQRPAHGTGDPAHPWFWVAFDQSGNCVVHLLTAAQVAGWTPLLPIPVDEDDDLEPEITWPDEGAADDHAG